MQQVVSSPVRSQKRASSKKLQAEEPPQVAVATPARRSSPRSRPTLQRDSTGRYLPRGASSPSSEAAAVRRRVEVQVITAPQVEAVRTRRSPMRKQSVEAPSTRVTFVDNAGQPTAVQQKPRRSRRAAVAQPAAASPTANVIRSRYCRPEAQWTESPEAVEQPTVAAVSSPKKPRARSASPKQNVSRRDYATPSLTAATPVATEAPPAVAAPARRGRKAVAVTDAPKDQTMIAPSTVRRVRKMSTTSTVEAPAIEKPQVLAAPPAMVERLACAAPAAPAVTNSSDMLWSYLNAP